MFKFAIYDTLRADEQFLVFYISSSEMSFFFFFLVYIQLSRYERTADDILAKE